VSTERCFELACGSEADLEQLRRCDQLNIERAAQRSFHGFTEGERWLHAPSCGHDVA